MFAIKKGLYKITSYHCRNCGGMVEPGQDICDFCKRKSAYKKYKGKGIQQMKARLLIDSDEDFVVFDGITSMSSDEIAPESIEVTLLGDEERQFFISGAYNPPSLEIEFLITDRSIYQLSKLDLRKTYKTRLEMIYGENSMSYDIDGCLTEINTMTMRETGFATQSITLLQVGEKKLNTRYVPDGMTCPNCGAPIKSRYGVCDYCSGWIEWEF